LDGCLAMMDSGQNRLSELHFVLMDRK